MLNKILILILLVTIGIYGASVAKDKNAPSYNPDQNISNDNVVSGEKLDLSNQGLSRAPSYIFNMENLKILDLSNNQIDGALQAEVRNLKNLKTLDLSSNKFTGIPAEIGQLKNLEVLDLSNNSITGLPLELGSLSKLKILDLSGNKYSEYDLNIIIKNLPSTTTINR